MARILIHVEGRTETDFINGVLAEYLYQVGFTVVSARLLGNARRRNRRSGIREWKTVKKETVNHHKGDSNVLASLMVDYWGLPDSWPGRKLSQSRRAPKDRADTVQKAVAKQVSSEIRGPERFIAYVVMHEFKDLLFSDPGAFATGIGRPCLSREFTQIRREFDTPEHVNDSSDTAPSKRIGRVCKGYQKRTDGIQAFQRIGIETVREACPLFHDWVCRLAGAENCSARQIVLTETLSGASPL